MISPNKQRSMTSISLLVVSLVFGVMVITCIRQNSGSSSVRSLLPRPVDLIPNLPSTPVSLIPKYRVVEVIPYDSPIKTQLQYSVVLKESTDVDGIKRLLDHLLDLGSKWKGFNNKGGTPTHVFAYVYPSEEHTGINWIGMVSKIGRDVAPEFDIKKHLLNAPPPEELKFGLPIDKRTVIFRESFTIDDTARLQAEAAYPLPDPRLTKYSAEATTPIVKKQAEKQTQIQTKLRVELCKRYGISENDFYNIVVEGVRSNWSQSK